MTLQNYKTSFKTSVKYLFIQQKNVIFLWTSFICVFNFVISFSRHNLRPIFQKRVCDGLEETLPRLLTRQYSFFFTFLFFSPFFFFFRRLRLNGWRTWIVQHIGQIELKVKKKNSSKNNSGGKQRFIPSWSLFRNYQKLLWSFY